MPKANTNKLTVNLMLEDQVERRVLIPFILTEYGRSRGLGGPEGRREG
jgi:hypothetical protein